ncbi:MAG: PPC domain-containing protein [Candidatus Thermoplasmatota archaeon]|nr:PPC domain-containing protein [Candidatus Thermoplasmatota archaeon]
MNTRNLFAIAVCLIFAISASGCFDSMMFSDADERFAKAVGGYSKDSYAFSVPAGASKLEVKYNMAGGGTVSISLARPGGSIAKSDSFSGGQANSGTFYSVSNPASGEWTLRVEVSGGASYAFGIYY